MIKLTVTDILVIFPLRIPLPRPAGRLIHRLLVGMGLRTSEDVDNGPSQDRRIHFTLGLEVAPVAGFLLLLASTCIPGHVVRSGIVGSEGVRPYDIMSLFLAFVSRLLMFDIPDLPRPTYHYH
jgi:hypothetical protein